MSYTFDGTNKKIFIDSLTPNVNVQDLYSRWKDWTLENDNLKYLPAFRTFGGDITIEGQTAPQYYFLINGWRVVVDAFDATFETNLYTDEGDSPVITLNNGTAQIKNSDAPIIEYVQGETTLGLSAEYIYVSGVNGSDEFGDGSFNNPFSTLNSAKPIAIENNINKLFVLDGTHTLNNTFDNFTILSYLPSTEIILTSTGSYINTKFVNVKLSGTITSGPISADGCDINNLNNFNGYLTNCGINSGGIQFKTNSINYLIDCYTSSVTSNPLINMTVDGQVKTIVRNYTGGLEISNMINPEDYLNMNFSNGNLNINNSNTNGNIFVGGTVNLTNDGNGVNVNKSDTINEILGIDANNLTVSVDELAIANAVWNKEVSQLTSSNGTIGQHVSKDLLSVIKYLALK
jgi:hypothetical protein